MAIVCGFMSGLPVPLWSCQSMEMGWLGVWFQGYFDSSQAGKRLSDVCRQIRGDGVEIRSPAGRRSEETQTSARAIVRYTDSGSDNFSVSCFFSYFSFFFQYVLFRILNGSFKGLWGFVWLTKVFFSSFGCLLGFGLFFMVVNNYSIRTVGSTHSHCTCFKTDF